jgi:FkbM family methyltransferase
MKKIIFDVGANNGRTFYRNAVQGDVVYAFEPTPELARYIRDWVSKENVPNFNLYELAVSDVEGIQTLNISGQGDWGCTSLHEYTDNINSIWPGRSDFNVTHKVDVKVIRLDNFIKDNNIEQIDYLHIDTQGNDYNVLLSLGDKHHIVKEGVVEVPNKVHLYKTKYSKQDYIDLLNKLDFEITRIVYDGPEGNEENVYFRKKQ